MMATELPTMLRDAFHKHLDGCDQCRNHPFALCADGDVLLRAAGIEVRAILKRIELHNSRMDETK